MNTDFGFKKKILTLKILQNIIPVTNDTKYGIHGYDNADPSMHALFMAKGPLFAKGKRLKPVNTVDLYNLFCLVLDIKCKKNDGSIRSNTWDELFVKAPHHSNVKGKSRHRRIHSINLE